MKIINDIHLDNIIDEKTYVAIGAFDGIHKGHQEVIGKAVKMAKKNGGKSVVFTFANHPLEIIDKRLAPKIINSIEERIFLLEKLGVDYVVFQKFDREFSNITPEDFVTKLLKDELNAEEVFVGFNFAFGNGGKANTSDLKRLGVKSGIKVNETMPILSEEEIISSTFIRKLIELGRLEDAINYLGGPLFIIGEVIHGKKLGRKMGFPTANLMLEKRVYPPFGIYGASVKIEGEDNFRDAVVNIGRAPTLKVDEQSIEVHILDFDGDLYGQKIYLKIEKFLRNEKKFSSMDELKAEIKKDIHSWKEYLKEVGDGRVKIKTR